MTRAKTLAALIVLVAVALAGTAPVVVVGQGPAPAPLATEAGTVYLPVVVTPDRHVPVSSVLTPYDANVHDLVGPSSWLCNYGVRPEIVVASDGATLHVLAQDYDPTTAWEAVLLRIAPGPSGYKVTEALTELPMLDRVMGLAVDAAGDRYYASGVDEADVVGPSYPPLNTPRSDVVRVVKLSPAGGVLYNVDLDVARRAYDDHAELIINPMVAATSRLAVGGGELALVHGINTDPDWDIGGRRHQKALSTRLDAASGAVTRVSSVWVSHSFDQRLLYDGQGIIEYHLGDAFPRYLVLGHAHRSYALFHIKGELGQNQTWTRLGNIAPIEHAPAGRYIALFATESTPDTGRPINGPRNLAMVRVKGAGNTIDPRLPHSLTVTSAGTAHTNRLRWLTHYDAASNLHAERPKLIAIGGDRYVVLWEEWLHTGAHLDTYRGVYGMVIDDEGNTLRPATRLTDRHHLHRGDDAFRLGDRAGWMTGSAVEKVLYLHLVDAELNYELLTVG